jgi:WD40 repeat protein
MTPGVGKCAPHDQTLRVRDPERGEERTLEGHTNSVIAVAMTPDSKRAVSTSTSYDRTLEGMGTRHWGNHGNFHRGRRGYACALAAEGVMIVAGTGPGGFIFCGLWRVSRVASVRFSESNGCSARLVLVVGSFGRFYARDCRWPDLRAHACRALLFRKAW